MNLIDKIKADQLTARKQKEAVKASLLTTLIGEADMIGKNAGNRAPTDAEVVAIVKKFIKNIDETLKALSFASDGRIPTLIAEKEVLNQYQPKQLDEAGLRAAVVEIVASSEGAVNVGTIMKVLKTKFDGQYDGKMASTIINSVLSKA